MARGARAPEHPGQLRARSWWGVLKRTVSEFRADNLSDWAAALTYYSVLALFPMLIVLVALLGIVGQDNTGTTLSNSFHDAGRGPVVDTIQDPLTKVVNTKGGAGALL